MAIFALHADLSQALYGDMERAYRDGEWPLVVDAGYYAVFHGMEAMNALECRDSYTFADAADILENLLIDSGLGKQFLADYRYLFYFRRGALYGPHIPTAEQLSEFVRRARRGFERIRGCIDNGGRSAAARKVAGSVQ
jgi:hypothetical protein